MVNLSTSLIITTLVCSEILLANVSVWSLPTYTSTFWIQVSHSGPSKFCFFKITYSHKCRCFRVPLQQMTFEKHYGKRRNWSWWAIALLSQFYQLKSIIILPLTVNFLIAMHRLFQSRLLQICCMWERVKWTSELHFNF